MTYNSNKIILHLCADIGSDSLPYREAGYDVRCIGKEIGVENYQPPENVYGIIANPPCTMFSIARTTAKTPRDLEQGMIAVKHCLRIIWECIAKQYDTNETSREMPLKFWAIENPASGYLKWFLGKPRFVYCQSEYGQPFTKSTALWGCFNEPARPFFSEVTVDYKKPSLGGMYKGLEELKRGNGHGDGGWKAKCPYKFAKAFYEANQ
jgi:hypothetical protein